MPARPRDALDTIPDVDKLPPVVESALYILEALDAHAWEALARLAKAHSAGQLSYQAWHVAVSSIIERAARDDD